MGVRVRTYLGRYHHALQPWTGASVSRPLRACGTPYQGINLLWLWMATEAAGHSSPFRMTYRRAQVLGAQVRKGERGTVAIFYRAYRQEEADEGDEAAGGRTRRVLKSFTVFNACQIDGLPNRFFPEPRPLPPPTERDSALDRFFAAVPSRIRHWGAEAFYSPAVDQVTILTERCLGTEFSFQSQDLWHSDMSRDC